MRQQDSPLAVLHVEHIIPRIHGGTHDLANLALACIDCNLHKGTNLTGIDPQTTRTGQKTPADDEEPAELGEGFEVLEHEPIGTGAMADKLTGTANLVEKPAGSGKWRLATEH